LQLVKPTGNLERDRQVRLKSHASSGDTVSSVTSLTTTQLVIHTSFTSALISLSQLC